MVNGEFKCLGSTQHLKNKFGEGFFLTLKLKRKTTEVGEFARTESQEMFEEKNSVKEFIEQEFADATLKYSKYFKCKFSFFKLIFFPAEKSITTC